MSLNSELNQLIERKGYVSIDEIFSFVEKIGHKQSTAERELRASKSPNIKKVIRDNGTIKGYMWKQDSDVVSRINAESERMRQQDNSLQQTLI